MLAEKEEEAEPKKEVFMPAVYCTSATRPASRWEALAGSTSRPRPFARLAGDPVEDRRQVGDEQSF